MVAARDRGARVAPARVTAPKRMQLPTNSLCASAPRTRITSTLPNGHRNEHLPLFALAVAPILIVLAVYLIMSLFVLPRVYTGFLAEPRFGETPLSAVSGVWSAVTALAVASLVLVLILRKRLPELRKTLDAGANASVLPRSTQPA